jgi:hypothetical protein
MTRRRKDKPVERLRAGWTSTDDLAETMAAMFQDPPAIVPTDSAPNPPPAIPSPPPQDLENRSALTVVALPTDTVAGESSMMISAEPPATVPVEPRTTVAVDSRATVADRAGDTPAPGPAKGFWYTEGKEGLFAASRIRRIVLAQDALTHSEESVYDVLWGPKNQSKDEYRFIGIGYEAIAKAARVTKMNAKWIVERLIHKGFVQVETRADPLRRIPTRYKVFGYRAALDDMKRRNRLYVVRTGNGVLFAHPWDGAIHPTATVSAEPTAMVSEAQPDTVSAGQAATVAAAQPATVPRGVPATVAVADTLLGKSSETVLLEAIYKATGRVIDDGGARAIVTRCRANAPDFTNEELAKIAAEVALEAVQAKRANLTGWLIAILPGHFAGDSFRVFRETERQLDEQRQQRKDQELRRWRRILEDPGEPEELKQLAREVLGAS